MSSNIDENLDTLLSSLNETVPVIQQASTLDLNVVITDVAGNVVQVFPSLTFKVDVTGNHAEQIKHNAKQAVDQKKVVKSILPKEVYGFDASVTIVPLKSNNTIVGSLAVLSKADNMQFSSANAGDLHHILSTSKDSILDLISSSTHTSSQLKEVSEFMDKLNDNVKAVHNVVGNIKANTSRIKMLALNASIEAVRAGSSGAGFKIVANEMGKLSEMSAESVSNITQTLNDMDESITNVLNAVKQIDQTAADSLETAEKILAVINHKDSNEE